ncbi:MAG: thioredoxin [Candidatus Obscuribacterales bacterium]|nr:thioredoxin [Candidatus Obscuribacterales bacterium]
MKELLIAFFACLVIGAMINGANETTNKSGNDTGSAAESGTQSYEPAGEIIAPTAETSDAHFEQDVLASQVPVLVDFSAKWCRPCQKMSPIVDQVAKEYSGKVKVYKVDIDSNPETKSRFNISSIPTFMVFKNGNQAESHSGAVPKDKLVALINRHINQ